ncbi:MAG: 1-(5-phosphoribosyl)-5-[Clostridia bacterium]|nr:1-(5-phosphoribosyl)-5-[(5-phosphoribosylamino)methylideneamino]imidazole-4-carboxamide isomerase [Clostridia bacterium]
MKIFPAIDLFGGKAVRLYKGNYDEMTVYSDNPVEVALDFQRAGAEYMHLVDLEGARSGETPNIETIGKIVRATDMFVEVGGGIRTIEVVRRYFEVGVKRVILGTAAVTDRAFLTAALSEFGEGVAVGVDIRDGRVAIKGWTERSELDAFDFCRELEALGVKTIICTDISRDGAMQGANRELYRRLSGELRMSIIASGGVSSLEDVTSLRDMGLYGAIIGKAYYTGAVALDRAIRVAK